MNNSDRQDSRQVFLDNINSKSKVRNVTFNTLNTTNEDNIILWVIRQKIHASKLLLRKHDKSCDVLIIQYHEIKRVRLRLPVFVKNCLSEELGCKVIDEYTLDCYLKMIKK